SMFWVDKFFGPDRQVLPSSSLSFLPGAKIGVLGPNGGGKSTLLRIMAGVDEPPAGDGELARGASRGLLPQAPGLEPGQALPAAGPVAWLERFLADYKGTVMAVTHDRYFLDNVAGWILELDRGRGIPFQGNYSSWLEQKQARLAAEEKQESARRRALARELEW